MSKLRLSSGNTDILDAIELVVEEKGISKDNVSKVVEVAILETLQMKYGEDDNIHVRMIRKTGEIEIYKELKVVEIVKNHDEEIILSRALYFDPNAKIDDFIKKPLPEIGQDRSTINKIRSSVLKTIRSLAKEVEFEEYSKRIGQIIYGTVKKSTSSYCIVAVGSKVETIIYKNGMMAGETFRERDKITACIEDVRRSDDNFQIILSRSSDKFLAQILEEEVTEIKEGLTEIKAISRNAGSRSKVAVWSADYKIDPVGACIGVRGSRIKSIVSQLKGEKVDIISWDRDLNTFIKNAFVPGKILQINHEKDDSGKELIELIVPDENLSIAIGKRGQNVRLTSQLVDQNLDIVSESDYKKRTLDKMQITINRLIEAIDVDQIVSQFLVSEGFVNVEDIANSTIENLAKIKGFNQEIATAIHSRAMESVEQKEVKFNELSEKNNLDNRILDLPILSQSDIILLMENNVYTLQEVADLSSDDLLDIITEEKMSKKDAGQIVMSARKIIYDM